MLSPFARATGLAVALIALLLGTVPALAAAADPDPVAACDGTAYTTSTVDGREVVACDDGRVRDWQRVAIADAAITRPTGGSAALSFAVTRPAAGNPVFLHVRTANRTAVAPAVYTALDTTLVLEADQTSATVEVPVATQAAKETDKTLEVTLADVQGDVVAFDRARAVGTLRNARNATYAPDGDYLCDGGFYSLSDLPAPWTGRGVRCLGRNPQPHAVIEVANVVADPRAGSVTFHLSRPAPYAAAVLAYETVDGSGRAGVDYVATSGLVLAATDQPETRITVPLLAGPAADGDRSFSLRITSGWSFTPIPEQQPVATIRRLPAPDGLARLGRTLTATVPPGATGLQWERCDLQGACADIPGATGASRAPTLADVGSRLRLRATAPVADGGSATLRTPATSAVDVAQPDAAAVCDGTPFTTATVDSREVVACDDGGTRDWQRVTIADARVRRSTTGATSLSFDVTRPEAGNPLFLRYRTADGTASAGTDYTARDAVLVLEADETSATVDVPVATQPGGRGEEDRTLTVALADERGAGVELGRDRATGTLLNGLLSRQVDGDEACNGGLFDIVVLDGYRAARCLGGVDGTGWSQIAASSPVVDPAAGVATFRLERANAANPIWIDWSTVDGTASAGVDYTAASGQQLMTFGQRVATVTVPIAPGGAGGDRTFTLSVAGGQSSLPFTGTDGTATIRRIAPAPTGTAKAGETLAFPGADTDAATRQWQRCDAQGACWPIPGATGATLTLGEELIGSRLRVRATAPGDDGATIAALTPLTDAVVAADPVDPRVPVDPRDPTDPRVPVDPRDPNNPTDPRAPTDPNGPGGPGDPPSGGERPTPAGARVTGRRQQNRDVARAVAGSTNVVLRCSAACRLRVPLTVSEAARRRLGLRSTRIGVADGRARGAGLVRMQVRIARHERRRLLAIGRPITVVARIATQSGETVTVRFRLLPRR